ncbi:arabinose efflux permease family protein [Saccharomonospora marina XMU15]|uniref:Arabinose efflux permease family protein n=1 Tax=Saccharomonospora marina XMU15 TaxID=882083 RepID=H5X3P2_9PSEU|nr:MFS transporter [Saccharomonospora marina]EHR51055.1 arabinose efflux permease family protein [Saccharomonospora marina XMU15]
MNGDTGTSRLARGALYVGALLGPFGGGIVTAILPELGASFQVSASAAATSLTAYLVPLAGLMLVSGTLGERWGPGRTIRLAYVVYALAAAAAALAPWFWLFQLSRGLQGAANAFTLPLLMAKLAASTQPQQLGRALGLFGSMQALGQTSAPLVGGLAAEVSWRWGFAGIAATAVVLATLTLPPDPPLDRSRPPRLRDAWTRSIVLPGLLALVGWACLSGISFLVAFRLEDTFELTSAVRGLVLTGFGVAGFLTARLVGSAADRFGVRVAGFTGLVAGAALVSAAGLVGTVPAVAASWALAGVAAQLVIVAVNVSVVSGRSRGRGGAISAVQALRFLGMAAAPALFTAPYRFDPVLGFVVPAALLALVAPAALALRRPNGGRRDAGAGHSNRRKGTAPPARLRHSRG